MCLGLEQFLFRWRKALAINYGKPVSRKTCLSKAQLDNLITKSGS